MGFSQHLHSTFIGSDYKTRNQFKHLWSYS